MAVLYDPYDPGLRADPYPTYARLRREAPVCWSEAARAWIVSRYEDVQLVLRSPEWFSSDAVAASIFSGRPGQDPRSDPEAARRAAALLAEMPFELGDLVGGRGLISADPPSHSGMRHIVNRGFTPRSIAAWEPRAREVVEQCMAGLRRAGGFDLIADLAIPLPVTLIAEMLGVEAERRADFKRWSDSIVSATTGSRREQDPLESGMASVMGEFSRYFRAVVEARARRPRGDLISTLIRAQDGEQGLTPFEVVMFALLLLVAGNETTTNLIGNAVNALLDHPDQLERVGRDPGLVPGLVEETLRYDSPVQFVFRRARQPVGIAGVEIPENGIVLALLGSANRDERRFADPDRFDVRRDAQGHLAFGFGIHFCLGASLARLEARVALEALLPQLPRLARRRPEVEYIDSFLLRGPRRLELQPAA